VEDRPTPAASYPHKLKAKILVPERRPGFFI
jgi:hypothetical protein